VWLITIGCFSESTSLEMLVHINRYLHPAITITTLGFVCAFLWWLVTTNKERESELLAERRLVDRIVLGLLPSQILERLKAGERLIADWRPLACVLFMDIVGFTELSSNIPPRQLVQGLVGIFARIEGIVKKYPRVEKIKTIGDAFMCASGLLEAQPDDEDVVQVALLALELQSASFDLQFRTEDHIGGAIVTIPVLYRFGIHCGEVIAGVVSRERFTFDILGDTVNTASRMESTSRPKMIHVSDEVYARLKHLFAFDDNGINHVKGKGAVQSYFLLRKK
jgi:class 3 adenylate cyclase